MHAETCPHYLFLRSDSLAKSNFEGAKYVCLPPLRHQQSDLGAMWWAVANGTFATYSLVRCPDRYDHPRGKKQGLDTEGKSHSKSIPNGLPNVKTGLSLLSLYGLADRKGNLSPGLDAEIGIPQTLSFRIPQRDCQSRIQCYITAVTILPLKGLPCRLGPGKCSFAAGLFGTATREAFWGSRTTVSFSSEEN